MKGKKTEPELIYKVMLSYVTTGSYSETARQLDMPVTTVKKIVDDNKEKDEFKKLCNEKRGEFVETANKIIDKATRLLDKRLDTALDRQYELDLIMDAVSNAEFEDGQKLSQKEQMAIAKKISKLELNNLNEITTAIGTMYDKRALAKGEPTSNEVMMIKVDVIDE